MKTAEITIGMPCRVRRGYSTRPAVVHAIRRQPSALIGVRFTDVDDEVRSIPAGNRGALFGASVRPWQILPA